MDSFEIRFRDGARVTLLAHSLCEARRNAERELTCKHGPIIAIQPIESCCAG